MTDLVGSLLGPYHITEKLGRGGMADVYKAWHRELELNRAIKVIRPEFVTSDDFRLRFQKEAQGVARLRHANIVQVHDFGIEQGHYYMVMEFLDGNILKSLLVRDGKLSTERAIEITRLVADALGYAHERDLVHRDIKPDNIMLTGDGRAVLMDFGIAKLVTAATSLTQTGMGIGTPAYMAPEQAKGLTITPATDIYALGIVLFEMLTGRVPYDADTPIAVMLKAISDPMPLPRSINPDISERLQGVILKATAKDPMARYQDVRSFVEALLHTVASRPSPTVVMEPPRASPQPPQAETLQPDSKPGRWVTLAAAAITLTVGAYVIITRDKETVSSVPAQTPTSEAVEQQASALPSADANEIAWSVKSTLLPTTDERLTIQFAAGESIFLNVIQASATTDFILQSPGGRSEVFNTYRTDGPFVIRHAGQHTLIAQPRDGLESTVHAELIRLAEPVLLEGSIYPGDRFIGTTRLPGQKIVRHVELPADSAVYLQVMNSKTTADFALVAPDERTEIFNNYRDIGPVPTREAGVYTLHIDPRDAELADFEAAIFVVSPPEIDLGNTPLDTMITDRTQIPGQILNRTFQLTAGEHVFLHVARTSVTTDFTFFTPGSNGKLIESYRSHGPIEVPSSGTYTLVADPRDATLADHDLRLVRVTPPVIDGGLLSSNGVVKGGTQLPGQVIEYRLDLNTNAAISLTAVATSVTFDFRLMTSDRTQVLFDTYHTAESTRVPETGQYLLQADPRDEGVGTFELNLNTTAP